MDRTPIGIHIGLGAVVVSAAVVLSAWLPTSAGGWRLVPVAAGLAVIGAYTVDPVAVVALTGLADLLVVGFLVNQYGVLTWHGMADVYRLVALSVSAGGGLAFGVVRHWMGQRRRFMLPRDWAAGSPVPARGSMLMNKEEGSGA